MSNFIIIPQAECGTRIDAVRTQGRALQTEIHLLACSTLAHIRDHGDVTLAIRLLDALPNGQRVKALAVWYRKFSNDAVSFRYTPADGWLFKLAKRRSPEDFDIEAAYGTTFADLTAEREPTTMTAASLLAYLKRTANNDKKNADGSDKVSEATRELAAALFAAGSKAVAGAGS